MPFALATRTTGIIHFKHEDRGWSEKFTLKPGTQANQLEDLKVIVQARRFLSPSSVTILYARMSLDVGSHRSLVGLNSEAFGLSHQITLPVEGNINDPCVSLCFRVQADDGRYAMRFIRGIPDEIIHANTLVPSVGNLIPALWLGSPADAPDALVLPPTWTHLPKPLAYYSAVRYFNYILKLKTCLTSQTRNVVNGDVVVSNQGHEIDGFVFRGVRNHKTGRPSGTPRGRRMAG